MKTKQARFMSLLPIPALPKPCLTPFSSFASTFSGTVILIGLLILGTGSSEQIDQESTPERVQVV